MNAELNLRSGRRLLAALTLVAMLSVSLVSSAAGRPPVGKIFDCYTDTSLGLTYIQALELKTSRIYLLASFRKGNRLSGKPASGTYLAKGNAITWLTGAYKGYKGIYHPRSSVGRARIDIVHQDGSSFGVSCEQH